MIELIRGAIEDMAKAGRENAEVSGGEGYEDESPLL